MKKVNYWLACFMAATALATTFTACSSDDDPDFNPPTVSMGSATTSEIDLSEAFTFDLPVSITSEAGLASIVVKDSEGKEWLKQTEFTNPNSVTSVKLDLSSCTESKLLLLTVTATAKDGKVSTNPQPYSLNVNVPQLYVVLNSVSTITEETMLDIVIGRGVKALANAKVYLNNSVVETIDLTTQAKEKKILKSVALKNLAEGKNPVKVEIYEEGNATASIAENGEAIRIATAMANAYFFINNDFGAFEVRRNDNGLPEFVSFTDPGIPSPDGPWGEPIEAPKLYYWNLTYDKDSKHVIVIDETVDKGEGKGEEANRKFEFSYNEYNELTKVTLDGKDYVTDVVYENGEMTGYKIEGKEYAPKYAEAKGIRTRVDCLDAAMSGETFKFTGDEDANPLYVQGLPAVIPGDMAGYIPLQLIYSQYLFNSLGTTWTAGWKAGTDPDWEMPSLSAKVTRKDGKEYEYKFLY